MYAPFASLGDPSCIVRLEQLKPMVKPKAARVSDASDVRELPIKLIVLPIKLIVKPNAS